MVFAGSLNIPDGIFHVPGVIYKVSGDRLDIFSYKGEKPVENSPLIRARPVATCEPVPPAPITKTVTGW